MVLYKLPLNKKKAHDNCSIDEYIISGFLIALLVIPERTKVNIDTLNRRSNSVLITNKQFVVLDDAARNAAIKIFLFKVEQRP